MSIVERVREIVEPLLARHSLEVYDIELAGSQLRITIDRPALSSEPLDLDAIAQATRLISLALDEHDPIESRYTLEVSSPGLERRLRVPAHFEGAVGETVKLKLRAGVDRDRRLNGVVVAADDEAAVIRVTDAGGTADAPTDLRVAYSDIQQARTVFDWEPAPKPGKASPSRDARPTRPAPEKKAAS